MLKPVGLIADLEPAATARLPALRELRDQLDPRLVEVIVAHLKNGAVAADSMEMVTDPLDPAVRIPGGSGLQTDGIWLWRQDLWYYVQTYRMALLPEFVEHVLRKEPSVFRPEHCLEAMNAYWAALSA